MKFQGFESRLKELEQSGGYVVLSDGTRFRPVHSGIQLLVNQIKLRRDLGRSPLLSDFPEDKREEWRSYAKWDPDTEAHGQISKLVSIMAREIVRRGENTPDRAVP